MSTDATGEEVHRKRPPDALLHNFYVKSIQAMRQEIQSKSSLVPAEPYSFGPVTHALENIKHFESPASSGWTFDHIIRFQTVVLAEQPTSSLFPSSYQVRDDDKALRQMITDGFF